MDIPYRLDTCEAINQAQEVNLLGLGTNKYKTMLLVAQKVPLSFPQAFLRAKKSVQSDFFVIEEKKIRHVEVRYEEIAGLDLEGHEQKIFDCIGWAADITRWDDLYRYLDSLPLSLKQVFKLERYPETSSEMMAVDGNVRRFIRAEIRHFLRTGKTKSADLDSIRRIISAYALFDPQNEDVLTAMRQGLKSQTDNSPPSHVLAELLFVRIERSMKTWMIVDPGTIRRKLFAKLVRLGISPRQRMLLHSYFPGQVSRSELEPTLRKIREVGAKLNLQEGMRQRLGDYMAALQRIVVRGPEVYKAWFLDRDLDILKKLHTPHQCAPRQITTRSETVKKLTRLETLSFYPTKDYLDLFKGEVSGDCIKEALGEEHLRTPRYFSIRIFKRNNWIGNIYLLDYTREKGIILVDRIQIPRQRSALYNRFFEQLREVFIEMFADVSYRQIILPQAISNHGTLQKAYQLHKKGSRSTKVSFDCRAKEPFESLSKTVRYYVWVRRENSLS